MASMNESTVTRPVPALLYPTLLIAGVAVIVASMLGIAAMTGMLPQSQAVSAPATPPASATDQDRRNAKTPARVQNDAARTAVTTTAASRRAGAGGAARCEECGVVDTIRVIETKGQGSGVGVVAGGVVGGILGNQVGGGRGRTAMTVVGAGAGAYAGNELEKNMNKSVGYEIRVRMEDNSYRTFRTTQPDIGVGQRVKIRDGQLVHAG